MPTSLHIEAAMKQAGTSGRGIVFGDWGDAARLGDFKRFWLLRTN